MLIGMVGFGVAGWIIIPLFYKLNHSLYNRQGLASVTEDKFGEVKIADVITDDIMIVAYDFRNHTPVIFTKYAATNQNTADKMNVFIRDAA
jgi:patatin-like phospholipase/acyl hydrolase